MEFFIISMAAVFNIVIIRWKYNRGRHADAFTDLSLLLGVGFVFGGTQTGLTVATLTSAILSIYLLFYPPVLDDETVTDS